MAEFNPEEFLSGEISAIDVEKLRIIVELVQIAKQLHVSAEGTSGSSSASIFDRKGEVVEGSFEG